MDTLFGPDYFWWTLGFALAAEFLILKFIHRRRGPPDRW
jgi:hypothetical protein